MDMIDGKKAGGLNVRQCMRRGFPGPVDETDQCRISTQVYHIGKKSQVGLPLPVTGADQHGRFNAGKAVHKIGTVNTLPMRPVGWLKLLHVYIMQKQRDCLLAVYFLKMNELAGNNYTRSVDGYV